MRRITWWGHATVALEIDGTRLLTDPVLRPRVAHLTRRAPRPSETPAVDAVLISHVHRDHLDEPTLRSLGPAVAIVPKGAARHVRPAQDVVEVEAGDEVRVGSTTVRAVPAVHGARRGGRQIPALGYVVDDDLYFAGDTDLYPQMADLGPLELALIPIWGWGPSLGSGHLDPERAARALAALRPHMAVPIHWGTYLPLYLADDHPALAEPVSRFRRAAREHAPEVDLRVLEVGETLTVEGRRTTTDGVG